MQKKTLQAEGRPRTEPPGSVRKGNGASWGGWGAGQRGPWGRTLLESHSSERPPLHISVCFCRHRSRGPPRLLRAAPTPLQPLGFPLRPAPTWFPVLPSRGGEHGQPREPPTGAQQGGWPNATVGSHPHGEESTHPRGLGHTGSTLWVIWTSRGQASNFRGPQGGRGRGDLRPTHPH